MDEFNMQMIVDAVNNHPLVSYYIAVAAIIWPMIKIFNRAGFSPKPVAWLFLPFLGYLVTLGYLVFRPWPSLPPRVKKVKVKA